jgi:tripartite-type tricarboxylate transporter receptor subunit TctC
MRRIDTHGLARPRRHALTLAALVLAAAMGPRLAQATDYPSKPVKIVVAFSAGGPNDLMARILAAKLTQSMGQQFIIENKGGAGGTIGSDTVAKAPADGYTLLFPSAPFVTAPALYGSKLPYDTLKDFTGITKVAESPLVLTVPANSPYKSLKDLLAAAKAKPKEIYYGSGGVASTPHLAMSLLEVQTKTQFQHIPYKGGGPAIQALVGGGEIHALFDSITTEGTFIAAGKIRALAQSGVKRSSKLPNVHTMAEAGVPSFEMTHWVGLAAPAKTPVAILEKLHKETLKALASDDVKARFAEIGAEPAGQTREQFNAFLGKEVARWSQIVKQANIQPE